MCVCASDRISLCITNASTLTSMCVLVLFFSLLYFRLCRSPNSQAIDETENFVRTAACYGGVYQFSHPKPIVRDVLNYRAGFSTGTGHSRAAHSMYLQKYILLNSRINKKCCH